MSELVAYAQSFVSFLLGKLGQDDINKIKNIILFGSVARGEAGKESDIDLFIDVFENENTLGKKADTILKEFYESVFFEKYWHLIGIENEIKLIVGYLNKWKDLKTSIIANGITLYGKYSSEAKGKNFVLISWGKIEPESKRVWLSKTLYGYSHKGKRYHGLLKTHDGKKISSNCILVPIDSYGNFLNKFKQGKISPKRIHISIL